VKLKLIGNKEHVLWKGFNWSRQNLVEGSRDYVNEPLENLIISRVTLSISKKTLHHAVSLIFMPAGIQSNMSLLQSVIH
jgi:hypothetical protein